MLRLLLVLFALALIIAPGNAAAQRIEIDLTLLWEQIANQPDDFGVACMPLNDPARLVTHNAEIRFPLASVTKLLVFIEFAERYEAGAFTGFERIPRTDLNLYDLPGTNRGAHDDFMDSYPDDVDYIGLWDIAAEGMIQYSSNAASDYLIDYLSPIDWAGLYARLGLENSDYPHPLARIPLLMSNHETGQTTMADVGSLQLANAEALFQRYLADPQWRAAEIAYRRMRGRSFPDWEIQASILQQHTATGTPIDFLRVLSAIYSPDSPLDANVRQLVRTTLEWHGYSALDNTYREYGSKLGFYSGGVLALVAYGQPYDGEEVISAAFLRNIPRYTYRTLLEEDTIGDLAHWMNLNACAGLNEAIQRGV